MNPERWAAIMAMPKPKPRHVTLGERMIAITAKAARRGRQPRIMPLGKGSRYVGWCRYAARRPKAARLVPADRDGRASWIREGRAARRRVVRQVEQVIR